MSLTLNMSSDERNARERAMLVEHYHRISELEQTIALSDNPNRHAEALGDLVQGFTGLNRLSLMRTGVYTPNTMFETLLAHAHTPKSSFDKLQAYFPSFDAARWEPKPSMLAPTPTHLGTITKEQQRAMYCLAAWNTTSTMWSMTNLLRNNSKMAWKNVPLVVRKDPLFQQILALRCPAFYQSVVKDMPSFSWNPYACALSFKASGLIPEPLWSTLLDNAAFGKLMDHRTTRHPINKREDPFVYRFSSDQLPTLLDVHPAMFIQGMLKNETLRNSEEAQAWFVPMLEAMCKKSVLDSSYLDSFAPNLDDPRSQDTLIEVLQSFSPQHAQSLHMYRTLQSPQEAYMTWISSTGTQLVNPSACVVELPLPCLDLEA